MAAHQTPHSDICVVSLRGIGPDDADVSSKKLLRRNTGGRESPKVSHCAEIFIRAIEEASSDISWLEIGISD